MNLEGLYLGVRIKMNLTLEIYVENEKITLYPKGDVHYGILKFSVDSFIKRNLKNNECCIYEDGKLIVVNQYVKDINYKDRQINICFK